jgi:hypothetical protein
MKIYDIYSSRPNKHGVFELVGKDQGSPVDIINKWKTKREKSPVLHEVDNSGSIVHPSNMQIKEI